MKQTEIRLHQTTILTPEQYVAGLTDSGPGRSNLFRNSTDEYLKVHHRGTSEADVTEGLLIPFDFARLRHIVIDLVSRLLTEGLLVRI